MGKGHPCSGCGIVLVCLDIASEDNSLSAAHVLTVTPGKQTGNLILFKWNLRFWRPQPNPQGELKSSSSAAVLVINNNNSKDNSFPRLQKPSSTGFSLSRIWSGETDNPQFTPWRTLAVERVSDLAGAVVHVTAQPKITSRDGAVLLLSFVILHERQ